ncbi:hypothetical protein BD289DRAFT_221329 [Coniella lustricola]|uniref:Zn(2)-C6 fungal-type domain-containing protein n=1 Tax=Coniella lustricola TaxID=2025994 RepID=A0A2T3AB12_9PEZI|nr:hypothetical protein BD289DRAFT_221329 [Coniella lustricola]
MVEGSGSGSDRSTSRKRAKTGCITCKIRRVKCDETRPSCNRCTQSKRVCDGYLSEPGEATAAAAAAGPPGRPGPLVDRRRYGATTAVDGGTAITNRKPLSRRALALAIRQVQAVGPAARVLTPSPYLENDVACFDFFRLRLTAVPADPKQAQLSSVQGQSAHNFWNYTLLQVAHAEPAVWHAVAALGALYRQWEVVSGGDGGPSSYLVQNLLEASDADDDLSPIAVATAAATAQASLQDSTAHNDNHRPPADDSRSSPATSPTRDRNTQSSCLAAQAATCYASAMRLAQSIRDPSTMLVLSVSLSAAANISGKWIDRSVHFRAGQNITAHLLRQSPDGKLSSSGQLHAAESLVRLGLHWLTFFEETAPPPRGPEGLSLSSIAGGRAHGRSGMSDGGQWDLQRANIEMIGIFGRLMALARTEDIHEGPIAVDGVAYSQLPAEPAHSHPLQVLQDLAQWEQDMVVLLEPHSIVARTTRTDTRPADLYRTNSLDILGLKLLHTCTRLAIAVEAMAPQFNELAWDACLAYFERMVALVVLILRTEAAASPLVQSVMSLNEPAINMVLWLTTHRCRHPIVRRRALKLLRGIRRTEGAWMSTSTAVAAAMVVEIEERGGLVGGGERTGNKGKKRHVFRGGWAAAEAALIREIEAENADPRSWLGPNVAWQQLHHDPAAAASASASASAPASKMGWDVPAALIVPLHKRVLQVDVRVEYQPRIGESRGVLILSFWDQSVLGGVRVEEVPVSF